MKLQEFEKPLSRKALDVEAVTQTCSVKKAFLEISLNSQESTCARVSILIKLQASGLKIETLAQVFSCEFCEISKKTFSYRTPPVAASVDETNQQLETCSI